MNTDDEAGKKILQLKSKLCQKEETMEQLLDSINRVGSKLVGVGILPSIPGLFSCLPSSSKLSSSLEGSDAKNSQKSISEPVDILRDQLSQESTYSSSHFVNQPQSRNCRKMTNDVVSESLRALIQNMEQFKTYLIQVEDLRRRLSQLESEVIMSSSGGEATLTTTTAGCEEGKEHSSEVTDESSAGLEVESEFDEKEPNSQEGCNLVHSEKGEFVDNDDEFAESLLEEGEEYLVEADDTELSESNKTDRQETTKVGSEQMSLRDTGHQLQLQHELEANDKKGLIPNCLDVEKEEIQHNIEPTVTDRHHSSGRRKRRNRGKKGGESGNALDR